MFDIRDFKSYGPTKPFKMRLDLKLDIPVMRLINVKKLRRILKSVCICYIKEALTD